MFGILTKGDVINGLQITIDRHQFKIIVDEIELAVNSMFNEGYVESPKEYVNQQRQRLQQWCDEVKSALEKVNHYISKGRIKTKIKNNKEFETLIEECERCVSEIWNSLRKILGMADRRIEIGWKYKYDNVEMEEGKHTAYTNHAKLQEKITRLIDLVSRI